MFMAGSATVYDDLIADITQVRVQGTGISLNVTENTVDYTNGADLNDYLIANYQLSHSWKMGSVIYPHIHYQQTTAANPNWLISYRWQRNGQLKTTDWTNLKCNTPIFTWSTGILNQIANGASITPPANYSISDIIQFRVIRDTGNSSTLFTGRDNTVNPVRLTGVDIHYEKDTIGSRAEYSK
jgi:hypothetical protein